MLVGFYSHHILVLCGIPPPLICLFTDGRARAGSLDLRAGCRRSISTHQIWVSSSPAQSLGQNFSSKQQQVVYSYPKRFYLPQLLPRTHRKNTRGKITRLHFPAQNQGCSLLRLWSSLTMPTDLLLPWRRREGLAPLGCHWCLPGWCFRVTGGGDEPEQGHRAGTCSLAAAGDGGRAGRTEHVPPEHPSLSKCEQLKLVPT